MRVLIKSINQAYQLSLWTGYQLVIQIFEVLIFGSSKSAPVPYILRLSSNVLFVAFWVWFELPVSTVGFPLWASACWLSPRCPLCWTPQTGNRSRSCGSVGSYVCPLVGFAKDRFADPNICFFLDEWQRWDERTKWKKDRCRVKGASKALALSALRGFK